jgi:hypothetical protein
MAARPSSSRQVSGPIGPRPGRSSDQRADDEAGRLVANTAPAIRPRVFLPACSLMIQAIGIGEETHARDEHDRDLEAADFRVVQRIEKARPERR